MRRLAVFVEGYTEVIFVEKLIDEIAGANKVLIDSHRIRGGSTVPKTMTRISGTKPASGEQYYVLLLDCGNDDLVKQRIMEEHANLSGKGYLKIIGIRDVRPTYAYADISKLEMRLKTRIKTSLIPVEFILSIMEIEAWFLAEFNHYPKINPAITLATIIATLGFDPSTDDVSQRPTPTDDLIACYAIGGQPYTKGNAQSTLAALDFAHIYLELGSRIPYLKRLTDEIDSFLH